MAGKTDERVEAGTLAPPPLSSPQPPGDVERLAAHMTALGQITPAVAHDLRGPINAMVFNLEVLKETVASGRGEAPGGREKLLRYVAVLREELGRLHRGLEAFLSLTTGRGDKVEELDLREPVRELASVIAGPARKQQVQVSTELPDHPVQVEANRYLLRQALLQVALAALTGAGRGQTLHVALEERRERHDGARRSTLWIGGPSAPVEGISPSAPEPHQTVSPEACLTLAGALLAQQGSSVVPADRAGMGRGYEIEWKTRSNG